MCFDRQIFDSHYPGWLPGDIQLVILINACLILAAKLVDAPFLFWLPRLADLYNSSYLASSRDYDDEVDYDQWCPYPEEDEYGSTEDDFDYRYND